MLAHLTPPSPGRTGVDHTEGQVFQYTIDLNRKGTKRRRQPDLDETKADPVSSVELLRSRDPAGENRDHDQAAAGTRGMDDFNAARSGAAAS